MTDPKMRERLEKEVSKWRSDDKSVYSYGVIENEELGAKSAQTYIFLRVAGYDVKPRGRK